MDTVADVIGRDLDAEVVGRRAGDPPATFAATGLIERDLGWRASHDLPRDGGVGLVRVDGPVRSSLSGGLCTRHAAAECAQPAAQRGVGRTRKTGIGRPAFSSYVRYADQISISWA